MKWEMAKMGGYCWGCVLNVCKWRKMVDGPLGCECLELRPCSNADEYPGWALVKVGKPVVILAIWGEPDNPDWIDQVWDQEQECYRDLRWSDIGLDDKDVELIKECVRSGF